MRVVVISNGPVPYHTPILNELAQLVDLHVVYMSKGHPLGSFRNLWGAEPRFPYSFHWSLPLTLPNRDFRIQISAGVSLAIRRLEPDAILFSSWGPLVLEPIAWMRLSGGKSVMWAESTRWSGLFRGRASQAIRRTILLYTDGFVANGTAATDFLLDLGVSPGKIVTSRLPSALRVNHIRKVSLTPHDSPRFLFVGRLIERKRPLDCLRAFALASGRLPAATLLFVGDGPLRPDLEREAEPLGERVKFLGRLEGDELSAVYSAADFLIVPSLREVWGLVVNEALSHGLFVVATKQVGAALDLLTPDSGRLVECEDVHALSSAMIDSTATVSLSDAARQLRTRTVAHCTPSRFAADMARALRMASLEAN